MKVEFWVTGTPKGQPRPRAYATTIKGRATARLYDPGTAEHWKAAIAAQASNYTKAPRNFSGPVICTILFHFPRPKAHYKPKDGSLRLGSPSAHITKPDADNAAKAVLDVLSDLRFWRDDSQVCVLKVAKMYADGAPGAYISVADWPEPQE